MHLYLNFESFMASKPAICIVQLGAVVGRSIEVGSLLSKD